MTPWTAARQASLSITNSWSLLKFMSIELVMPSTISFSCCPLILLLQYIPASGYFNIILISQNLNRSRGHYYLIFIDGKIVFFLNISKLTKIILLGPWICIRRGQTLEPKEPLGPDIVISAFNYSGSISQKWIITFPFPIIFIVLNFHILAEILRNTLNWQNDQISLKTGNSVWFLK